MEPSLLEDYESEIEIRIEGKSYLVPENNSLLRVLQYLSADISYSRFCWNGDCQNCLFAFLEEGCEREALACSTEVQEGMVVTRLPEGIGLP